FSVEMTGYGRSTRPPPMNDPCNLSEGAQEGLMPWPVRAACEATYPFAMTTIESDWADLGAAVDYVRALRGVERVTLVGWSAAGPRAGGWASLHPEKVDRRVLLAPSYRRGSAGGPPESLPAAGRPYGVQSLDAFRTNLERQAPCDAQLDAEIVPVLWQAMLR